MTERDVAMAVLWLKGSLVVEERWEDVKDEYTGNVNQEPRYAFPGGTIEEGETERVAIIRKIEEETGIVLDPNDKELRLLDEPLTVGSKKAYVFTKLLLSATRVEKDGIIICAPHEVLEYKKRGKLMPFTEKYVGQEFIVKDGIIDNQS
jgi:8-oxo-dGTP pyrophosphatase MutT (NUDIX family)